MPGKHVRFSDGNVFYSPKPTPEPSFSESTPSPSYSESSLPSSSGPRTPPQQNTYLPLALPTGPVAIHPLLAFHPFVAPVIYDVSLPPHTLSPNVHASPLSLPASVLDEPATQPIMHTITLVNDKLPWQLTIPPSKHFVSVRDLLEALYCFLRHPVLASEYNTLPNQEAKDQVSIAFHTRYRHAASKEASEEQYHKGVKRVDFLCGRNRFMGLSSTKYGPHVWALNLS
ncbi:hypothetical protein BDN67DRAFT_963677 [Paxillus ammoniavirescens]|nr:hypothetical protein BDN67DRAFT_963677 [Paxillus ammoniavirescens]